MKTKSRLIFGTLILMFCLIGIFFLLPKHNCCDDPNPELEALTTRAFAGELDAINELYQRAKIEGVEPNEEYWALEGALKGDKKLHRAYVKIYKTRVSADRKQQLLESVVARSDMPGAPCLIEMMNEVLPSSSACNKLYEQD